MGDALRAAEYLWGRLNFSAKKKFLCWYFSFTLDAVKLDGRAIPKDFEFAGESVAVPPPNGGFKSLLACHRPTAALEVSEGSESHTWLWYRHKKTFGDEHRTTTLEKMADWLSDCYCLRLHDEVRWAPYRAFYQFFSAARKGPLGDPALRKVFAGRRGAHLAAMLVDDELATPAGRLLQRRVLLMDCLLFVRLCKVRGQLPPDELPRINFIADFLLPALAKKVCHPLSKEDALKKWGEENVFSSSPSLRRTGEQV